MLVALTLDGVSLFAQPPSPRVDDRGQPILTAHSDLVVLHVTVVDRKRGYVGALPQSAFSIIEDGKPEAISFFLNEATPVTVGLVIDNSGSMRAKRAGVVSAGLTFVRACHPEDELVIVNFNEYVSSALPPGVAFTSEPSVLRTALGRIGADGQTALYDGAMFALDRLAEGSRQKRILILVSDGDDNASRATREQVMARAQADNVVFYTIGLFDPNAHDANPGVLKALANATGGQAFFPRDPEEVAQIMQRISRDIRGGYTIGYVPSNTARDGKYRRIRVHVRPLDGRKLDVRARPGYLAPSSGVTGHLQ
jgi:Ca-activated chloride channel homolog